MGLLRKDRILSWEELCEIKNQVKEKGIKQFIHIYNLKKDVNSTFSVGDEIELMLTADQDGRKVLTLVSEEMIECFNAFHGNIIKMLKEREQFCCKCQKAMNENFLHKYKNIIDDMKLPKHSKQELLYLLHYNLRRISNCRSSQENILEDCKNEQESGPMIILIPEFASYMLETIPLTVHTSDFKNIFDDMHRRISLISTLHHSFIPCSKVMLMSNFPMLYLNPEDYEENEAKDSVNFESENLLSVFFDKKIKAYDFSIRSKKLTYDITDSLFFPDNAVNVHPRFSGLLKNIVSRRSKTIEGYVSRMSDICCKKEKITVIGRENKIETKSENKNNESNRDSNEYFNSDAYKNKMVPSILIDSMGQGMGCSCIQFTYQLENINIARFIYDQLTILAPLLLRVMRGTPFSTNYLLNVDTRWEIVSMSVDDRIDEERGGSVEVKGLCKCGKCDNFKNDRFDYDLEEESLKNVDDNDLEKNKITYELENRKIIPQWAWIRRNLKKKELKKSSRKKMWKSRFSSSDLFISKEGDKFNDTSPLYDKNFYKMLLDGNVDEILAKHISVLFIRDPMIYYETESTPEEIVSYDDFENIQSSNWRSTRFKIPIDDGWRVELRSLEIQPTIYENSNFAVFISCLVQWLITEYKKSKSEEKLNNFFYVPMSSVETNFSRASLFTHKESDYYDDKYLENEKLLEEFYEKTCKQNEDNKKLTFSYISETSRKYNIKVPEDNVKFHYRDIKDGQIKENTTKEIFIPICDILNEKFPQYKSEIQFVRERVSENFVSTSDFIRYSLINDPNYIRGSSYINRAMSDRLIIKMDKIRKMDHWLYKNRRK